MGGKLCCVTAGIQAMGKGVGASIEMGSPDTKRSTQSPLRHIQATFCAEVLKGEEGSASGDFPGSARAELKDNRLIPLELAEDGCSPKFQICPSLAIMHREINVTYKIYGRAALLVSFFKVILKIKPHFPQGGEAGCHRNKCPGVSGSSTHGCAQRMQASRGRAAQAAPLTWLLS